jgi:hypothetical protein
MNGGNMTRNANRLLAAAAMATLFVSNLQGSTLSVTNGSPAETAYNSIGVGQTVGKDGYYLFATGGTATTYTDTSNLPSYATSPVTTGDLRYGGTLTGEAYEKIAVYPTGSSSTTIATGVAYQSSVSATLASFTLTGVVPTEFQLGLLGNNSESASNYTDFLVTDSNSQQSASNSPGTSYVTGNGNDFYFVDITGASAGDTVTIVGTKISSNEAIGGIAFDTIIQAPEPATLGIMAIGAIGLLARRHRAKRFHQRPLP